MLKIFLTVLLILIIAGYFFIQWANQPKNVQALLKARIEAQGQAHLYSGFNSSNEMVAFQVANSPKVK